MVWTNERSGLPAHLGLDAALPAADAHAVGRTGGVLFPSGYSWLVLAGSLDIICTHVMLSLGAIEVNAIANAALSHAGLWGLIALKFTVVVCVLMICEYVGRRRYRTARSLVNAGVAINFVPVVFSIAQLVMFSDDWFGVFMRG